LLAPGAREAIQSVILNTGHKLNYQFVILREYLKNYLNVMNFKIFLLLFFTIIPVFSDELTELQKVDQRLEELKTIWRQDTAIINQLTNFKRTAVQQGSQAYYKCLEASQRIQQAEAEAKTLKERRASISTEGATVSGGQSTAKAELKLRQFDFDAIKIKSESKKGTTLIFKSFYIGMPGEDALGLLNYYMKLPQVTSDPIAPAKVNLFTRDGKGPYFILKTEKDLLIAKADYPDRPVAKLDDQGKVTELRISAEIRDCLFDLKETPLKEFIQTFIDQYDVPAVEASSESIEYFNQPAGSQEFYTHRGDKGYELKFFGKLTVFDQKRIIEMNVLGIGNQGEEGSFTIKSIQTKNERSGNFD
jgi:hypothetical protein